MRLLPRLGLPLCGLTTLLAAQSVDPALLAGLRWRCIGPFRGGRTVAIAGVPARPGTFYMAPNNGGVWRSTDYGHVWKPIFDGQPTGSVGALAVAPSNPDVIYVGSGEGLQRPDLSTGDGLYKSTDGGQTWTHLGLRDGQQIGSILVDPGNPDRLFVAVLGHPYGPNAERGVFRSLDGGRTFEKVLYKNENTGAIALAFDPSDANVIYADLWAARQAPWENGEFQGPGSGLFKSTDGGTTWHPLTKGLPTFAQGLGRIGFAVAPSDPKRLYAQVDAKTGGGTYRSEDAGESWTRVNDEARVWGRGSDFAEVRVDPKNPDVIYVANTSTYRSSDGGKTFTAIKGAPGGDDYHSIWIDPANPRIILLGSDQGATLSVNGGETWSSWYNQPTAQFYHVITDNRFPYWVYGGQQESGSVGISSRGDDGAITFRDWRPVGVEEYGYVAPDPLDANLVYGGKATRFDWRTHQVQDVGPAPLREGGVRFLRTMPLLFSPVDPHILYLAGNVLFKTVNGGKSWETISPDLSRTDLPTPSNVGVYAPEAKIQRRGVIYALAPSFKDVNHLWAGTDDGLIHTTWDGGRHWEDVTPKGLAPWSKIAQLEASHFDEKTCYAAVNTLRLDDLRPHLYRTRDGGKSWQEIVAGLPDGAIVNTVREDPKRRGLLFAGTENTVHVSFDDGDHWQSLRANLPATSIRDLVIHGDDLVVGTHGRSFWILDDMALLREVGADSAKAPLTLFKPQTAMRVRWNINPDTPLPPEEPAGQNPPDGAILDYWVGAGAAPGPVSLEILDGRGRLVRRFTSEDKPEPVEPRSLNVPMYWVRPTRVLSFAPGAHRFVWDLHFADPASLEHDYPISAIEHDTPREPRGPWALPGRYTVRLSGGGKTLEQPLVIEMDPRVKTPAEGLLREFELASGLCKFLGEDAGILDRLRARRKPDGQDRALEALIAEATELNGGLAQILALVEGADAEPTTQIQAAVATLGGRLAELKKKAEGK